MSVTLQKPESPPPAHGPAPATVRRVLLCAGGAFAVFLILDAAASFATLLARHSTHGSQVVATARVGGATSVNFDHSACSGKLEIVGEDRTDIALQWKDTWSFRKPKHRFSRNGERLSIDTICPWVPSWSGATDLVVRIPKSLHLQGGNDSGSLRITNVTNGVDMTNDSGSINLTGVAGDIDISADSGSVRVSDVAAGGAIKVSADSGSVRLDLDEMPTRVDVNADSGSIRVNVPEGSEWDVDVHTDSGSQDINVRERTGATPMELNADSGSVHVDYR